MSANKARGTRWEGAVRDYLNDEFGFDVYRPAQEGFRDSGDLHGLPYFAVQCKDWREVLSAIREGLEGVTKQKVHARKPFGVNVVKRAHKPTGQAYAVLTLEDFAALLSDYVRLRDQHGEG